MTLQLRERIIVVSAWLLICIAWRPAFTTEKLAFQASHNGFGWQIRRDLREYLSAESGIVEFESSVGSPIKSRTILTDSAKNRELLVLLEGFGYSVDRETFARLTRDLERRLQNIKPAGRTSFSIMSFSQRFYGNSSSAEAREILWAKGESSFSAFVNAEEGLLQSNLVSWKQKRGYRTVAGYSGTQRFASAGSNVTRFRRLLGFDAILMREDFDYKGKNDAHNKWLPSVIDEVVIDSVVRVIANSTQAFGYVFTTATHFPFALGSNRVSAEHALLEDSVTEHLFEQISNKGVQRLLERQFATVLHAATTVSQSPKCIDRVVFVGDHPYPGMTTDTAFVPGLIMTWNCH